MMPARIAFPRLSIRDRRMLVRGGAAIGAVLLIGKGLPAWRSWQHDTVASARELTEDASRARALGAMLPEVRDSLHLRFGRLQALDSTLVHGNTPGSAAATLASLVGEAAADAGVKLGGLEPRADTGEPTLGALRARVPASPFVRVSVHGEMTGDVVSIMQFLADIEHGPTTLVIRELSIMQPDPAAPTDRMETLHGELTVVGLARRALLDQDARRPPIVVGRRATPAPLPGSDDATHTAARLAGRRVGGRP